MSSARGASEPTSAWMLRTSAWMLLTLIPGSYLSWLGFLIVGIVGRMLRWTIVGVVLGALAIVVHLPVWGQWQSLLSGLLYIAGMLLALMANPGWLRAMWQRRTRGAAVRRTASSGSSSSSSAPAGQSRQTRAQRRAQAGAAAKTAADAERAERAQRAAAQSRARAHGASESNRAKASRATKPAAGGKPVSAPAPTDTEERSEADLLAERAGASSAEFFATTERSAIEPVDVNTADAGALADLLGISTRQARRLVKQRSTQGGFASLDAFATAAGLQPHELVRLRGSATCSRPARGPRQFGRRVDY